VARDNPDFHYDLKKDTVEELQGYSKECASIRVTYPGYAMFEFQMILDLVMKHILCWDEESECSYDNPGPLGKLNGWFVAVEEQGWKTLHAHILVWISEWTELLSKLYSTDENIVQIL
jgi:hypothetical protein